MITKHLKRSRVKLIILQTGKKLFDSHSSMFIFSRKQLGVSQFWKNIFNCNVINQSSDPLPCFSNIFERIIQNQLLTCMDSYLSPFLCRCRKIFRNQTAFLWFTEKRKFLNTKCFAGGVLMDLLEAFDAITHEILIANLHANSSEKGPLKMFWSYLSYWCERAEIHTTFSSWTEIKKEVSQATFRAPLFFNMFSNDLFLFLKERDICSYANDSTAYACDQNLNQFMKRLELDYQFYQLDSARVIIWSLTRKIGVFWFLE